MHYHPAGARVARVLARAWEDPAPAEERVFALGPQAEYVPGRFWERELPCLLHALRTDCPPLFAILVDAYVHLDTSGAPGLGAHLFAALGGLTPIVGLAKRAFRGSPFATPVLRGASRSPLFVTAIGCPVEAAAAHVRVMHGPHRIPTLVKRADQLCRGLISADGA